MGHNPVNHPLRPVYRALGALAGLYLVIFGVLGAIQTAGNGLFTATGERVLGQDTNLGGSILAVLTGLAALVGIGLGRNIDVAVNTYLGWGLLVVGLAMLTLNRTDLNVLGYSVATVIVTWIVGLVLITAGLYGRVAPPEQAGAPRQVRQRA